MKYILTLNFSVIVRKN